MLVLHLEDTKPLRDILRATMTTLRPGCEVQQFMDSDEAIAYIEQYGHDVDIFLLDVRVPGSVDGLGVAEVINHLGCNGIVILTSAYMSPGHEKLNDLNARWFQKPWQIEDIQEMLRLAANRPDI